MGNILSGTVLAPVSKLYRETSFRNRDDQFPRRQLHPAHGHKNLELPGAGAISVPVYVTRTADIQQSGPGVYDVLVFNAEDGDGVAVNCDMLILYRDIGLEHYSSLTQSNVCQALGISRTLGVIYVYSLAPIPLPPTTPTLAPVTAHEPASSPPAPREKHVECAICYERGDDIISTRCKHDFCRQCLNRWSQINRTCPYCRCELG